MKTAYEVGLFNLNIGIYISILFAIISIAFFIYRMKHRRKIKTPRLSIIIILMLSLIFTVISELNSHYTQFYELKSGNYKIIEGEISNYKRDAKGTQYFSVNGQDFKILSNAYIEQPFHSDDFAKNLSDNKYLVKIYYLGNQILKVDYQ